MLLLDGSIDFLCFLSDRHEQRLARIEDQLLILLQKTFCRFYSPSVNGNLFDCLQRGQNKYYIYSYI